MFKQVLPQNTQKTLALLSKTNILKNFYLSGGTCCALYLGHRISQDLDFFTSKSFSAKKLRKELHKLKPIKILGEDTNTLHCILHQTRLSLLKYPYKLLKPHTTFQEIKISSLVDVLCSKLDTIVSRGSKKDFIDLYFALKSKKFKLIQVLKAFQKKYKGIDYSLLHILKGLTYFIDADEENMPKMLKKASWPEIKQYLQKETIKLTKSLTNS